VTIGCTKTWSIDAILVSPTGGTYPSQGTGVGRLSEMQRALHGTISYPTYVGSTDVCPIRVEVLNPDGTTLTSVTAPVSATGEYSVPLPDVVPGSYDLRYSAAKCLSRVLPAIQLPADPVDVTLVNGDLNGDNSIGFADFNILRANWGLDGD
jgi:hypothetical protein